MEQTEYIENDIAPRFESEQSVPDSLSETVEEREYPSVGYAWSALFLGIIALVVVGIVGGILALLLFNYTSGGFS